MADEERRQGMNGRREKWVLKMSGRTAASVVETWFADSMPCDMRLRRCTGEEDDTDMCEIVAFLKPEDREAKIFLNNVIGITGCSAVKL